MYHTPTPPIPEINTPSWETVYAVPTVECDEAIFSLALAPEHFLSRSVYFDRQIPASLPECYARASVQEKLLIAASLLPSDLRLVILDGWRSISVQTFLFNECVSVLKTLHPNETDEELKRMAQQYVARPTDDINTPAPHSTGGAIDLIIAERSGKPLFFGATFDYPGDISRTRYFEEMLEAGEPLSKKDQVALNNRRLLYHVMTQAGFVNFHGEWWHFEYGTQRWALEARHEHAVFAPKQFSLNPYQNITSI